MQKKYDFKQKVENFREIREFLKNFERNYRLHQNQNINCLRGYDFYRLNQNQNINDLRGYEYYTVKNVIFDAITLLVIRSDLH